MAADLKLSVVMATYGRAQTLQTTLRHLATQTLDPSCYELIVVDDESPDDTGEVVAEWAARVPFRLRYLRHANRGPGYTQNRGLDVAEGRVVLFMADDIFMQPGALAAHLAVHEANPAQEVAVLGRVEQDDIPGGGLFLRKWDAFGFRHFEGLAELPYYRFWACNVSAKRDFLQAHGGFREHKGRAGYAAHEDTELGYRLSTAGLKLLYAPDALGLHHHIVAFGPACKRRFMQGMNFGEFRALTKAPEIAVVFHVLAPNTLMDHWRALTGPRRRYLAPSDRNPLTLLARHAAFALLFNRLTVRMLWEPFLERAEHDPRLERFVHPAMYRGVIFHHFILGCREGDRMEAQSEPATLMASSG